MVDASRGAASSSVHAAAAATTTRRLPLGRVTYDRTARRLTLANASTALARSALLLGYSRKARRMAVTRRGEDAHSWHTTPPPPHFLGPTSATRARQGARAVERTPCRVQARATHPLNARRASCPREAPRCRVACLVARHLVEEGLPSFAAKSAIGRWSACLLSPRRDREDARSAILRALGERGPSRTNETRLHETTDACSPRLTGSQSTHTAARRPTVVAIRSSRGRRGGAPRRRRLLRRGAQGPAR